MDNYEYDIKQRYALEIKYATRECYFVHFKTLFASSNTTGNFFIDGYGSMPNECYSEQGAECNIEICGRRTLIIRAFTPNKWQFEISGDIGHLYNEIDFKYKNTSYYMVSPLYYKGKKLHSKN